MRCSMPSPSTACRSRALTRLIAARRFDLYDDPMPDIATFEGYAGETVSALYQLARDDPQWRQPVETGDAAGHLGVAHALIGHLRAFGYNASQGRIFLPWSVLCRERGERERSVRGPGERGPRGGVGPARRDRGRPPGKAEAAITVAAADASSGLCTGLGAPEAASRSGCGDAVPARPDIADWRKMLALTWWRMRVA